MHAVVGVDIGGSGVKGAVVDVTTGALLTERLRIDTPQPATPEAVCAVAVDVWRACVEASPTPVDDRCGMALPAVVTGGVVRTAANIDSGWIDCDAQSLLAPAVGAPVAVLNDADAAGLAEVRFGAAHGHRGTVVCLTLGTGIGSAVFHDGVLVPNTEFGHLLMGHRPAEQLAAARVRKEEDLSWGEWADRVSLYLQYVESLLWPDVIVIGGGVSRKAERFLPHLRTRTTVVPAVLRNNAGIVGAALRAVES